MEIVKPLFISCWLLLTMALSTSGVTAPNPDSTGLPGDHFNLEGALDLFKNSNSLEEFEKRLNTQEGYVNNLDLNGDGEVDYLKVYEYTEGNTHVIVIQTSISETESQDVAVIEIEKNGTQSALIQIVGDEDLYGEERIVEPAEENFKTANVQSSVSAGSPKVVINVWAWPAVRYIYAPGYIVYRPAWRWRYYPVYWKPWRTYPYRRYAYYARPYRVHYQVVHVHRVVHAPRIYKPYRTTSIVVKNRHPVTRVNRTVNRNTTQVHVHQTNHRKTRTKAVQAKNRHNTGSRGHRGGNGN